MMQFLWVALGGAFGAVARFGVSEWAAARWGTHFPYGTLVVNLSGSFLLGLILTLAAERVALPGEVRLLTTTGFMGAYTTFSTFSWETARLFAGGGHWYAVLNVVVSVLGGLLAVLLGILVARAI
ncbi:fluoride efflux transporter CrcB [Sphaerobacter thermophilus]|jgi:CrcB protein|uniref:fluoride efflux transporter CrcB n=1 Tax=Sphaerobacter thermophilus TaxID=2057 RepID=UPI002355F37B